MKQLRPRQKHVVDNALDILKMDRHKDEWEDSRSFLIIAPTGSGKTVMFSHLASQAIIEKLAKKVLILVHRVEIFNQNVRTFRQVNEDIKLSVWTAEDKSMDGQVVFGMVISVLYGYRENKNILDDFDLIIIDEAHHAPSRGYKKLIENYLSARSSNALCGFTATPNRADKKSMSKIFKKVCDQIFVDELVQAGLLVKPKIVQAMYDRDFIQKIEETRVVDGKLRNEYDMELAQEVMNSRPVHEQTLQIWEREAKGRQTVVFCTLIKHAKAFTIFLKENGQSAEMIDSDTDADIRRNIITRYSNKEITWLVNVNILTEGWDNPQTSCVAILRPCSAIPVVLQMIGRGLRICDGKDDCVVLDMGISCTKLLSLEQFLEHDVEKIKSNKIYDQQEPQEPGGKHLIEYIRKYTERLSKKIDNNLTLFNPEVLNWHLYFADNLKVEITINFDVIGILIYSKEEAQYTYGCIIKTNVIDEKSTLEFIGLYDETKKSISALLLSNHGIKPTHWHEDPMTQKQRWVIHETKKQYNKLNPTLAQSLCRECDISSDCTKSKATCLIALMFSKVGKFPVFSLQEKLKHPKGLIIDDDCRYVWLLRNKQGPIALRCAR